VRIYSYIKVFAAALTIAFAVMMGTVPVSAQVQPPVSVSNITQVQVGCKLGEELDIWCGKYDKIAPDRWVQRTNDGKTFPFAQNSNNNIGANMISMSDASRGITLLFDFGRLLCYGEMKFGGRSRSAYNHISRGYEISSDSSPDTCRQESYVGVKCNCDLRTLQPLQGAVGMEEVRVKAKDIVDHEKKKRVALAYDPIKLVRSPGYYTLLYITDHHHGARAWLEAGHTMGTCVIQSAAKFETEPSQFWADLKKRKLVREADKNGNPITVRQGPMQLGDFPDNPLPRKLSDLPDDPYRTLAWRVRKGDGFCRALMTGKIEFAEFQWADWLRKRPEFQNPPGPNDDWSGDKIIEAVALAKTSAASGLPGYRGDKRARYKCDPDPDPE
jgi:hypothetical protein